MIRDTNIGFKKIIFLYELYFKLQQTGIDGHLINFVEKLAEQNLSHQAKYNQGFGYAKQTVNIALEISCKNELNKLLKD